VIITEKKHNEALKMAIVINAKGTPTILKIWINKNHYNKTLHLFVEINNPLVEWLVHTKASMSIMLIDMIHELGIMHLMVGFKFYNIIFEVITQTHRYINVLHVKVVELQYFMTL
jgi:hypothetical protein